MATRSEKRITVAEYERMIEDGLLTEDDRVELLEGEIVAMSPIGFPHRICVANLTEILVLRKPSDIVVSPGGPIILSDISEPEPDLTLHRERPPSPGLHHPHAGEVLLAIEVSDSSLSKDLGRKRRLYAEAGVPEYWVVDIPGDRVHRFLQPNGGAFAIEEVFGRGQALAPRALPGLTVEVDALFKPR